jgi:hypothetical protein
MDLPLVKFPPLVAHCKHCNKGFFSALNNFPNIGEFIGNVEQCPRCKNLVNSPSGRFLVHKGVRRFLPFGTSATPTENAKNIEFFDTIYLVLGNEEPLGTTWKFFLRKNDLYIVCRELPEFKISLHASGSHNLSYTSEHSKKINLASDRHFHKIKLPECYLAHYTRVTRLFLYCSGGWKRYQDVEMPVAGRKSNLFRIINFSDIVAVDILCSVDHPNEFAETSIDDHLFLGTILSDQGVYYTLMLVDSNQINSMRAVSPWKELAKRENLVGDGLSVSVSTSISPLNTLMIEAIHF